MNERGILFTPENYAKCESGVKTQTRRIMKPQPPDWVKGFGYTCFTPKGSISGRGQYKDEGPGEKFFKSRYGIAGDRLYVKEGFLYRLAGEAVLYRNMFDRVEAAGIGGMYGGWKSPLFMPKHLARLVLEITAVRVERLHDISEEDAVAEGCERPTGIPLGPHFMRGVFRGLWESNKIHKPGSWDLNPWVWILEFRRLSPDERTTPRGA